jgi:hypothetical protein
MPKPKRILPDGQAVRSNLIARDTLCGADLTAQERKEYDYLGEELDGSVFFRFKGQVYGLCEFSATAHGDNLSKAGWNGYAAQSFFHAVVISVKNVNRVIVGELFS